MAVEDLDQAVVADPGEDLPGDRPLEIRMIDVWYTGYAAHYVHVFLDRAGERAVELWRQYMRDVEAVDVHGPAIEPTAQLLTRNQNEGAIGKVLEFAGIGPHVVVRQHEEVIA